MLHHFGASVTIPSVTLLRRAIFKIDASELVGSRLRVDGHFSRTGIQHYSDGIKTTAEYRPPEEVFADAITKVLRLSFDLETGLYIGRENPDEDSIVFFDKPIFESK